MGFGQGLSGLNTASQDLDVIGNNISNAKTVGFKAASTAFADIYASSRVGLGVQMAGVTQRFTTGVLSVSGNELDIAIDGTRGLFVITSPTDGTTFYTRNGQFTRDKENRIVNAQGNQLMGFNVDNSVTPPRPIMGGGLVGLTVPVGNIEPKFTETVKNKLNLDADADILSPVPAPDLTDPTTFSTSTPVTVYDSLGKAHRVDQVYQRTGTNAWTVTYQYTDPATGTTSNVGSANLTFDTAGRLVTTPAAPTGTIALPAAGGAAALNVTVSYDDSTQFSGGYTTNFVQDGYASGEFASLSIGTDGAVVANYTNGAKKTTGFVAMADFNNLQGLQSVGGNAWVETASSGQAIMGTPGSNGLASVKGQAVEESNVDMSQELVNLIIAQRTYQANAQTIKTQDQVLQTLMAMR
ncbi:Flagellar hook protein FlgE [Castellaniella defragrans 65Phen]|uniref:Flagellar hook protein FlgE n=2 Tax=Castellaniella defragrans TaxID=75697 RepID=W8X9H3_CASD6|nr:flagellar hook protein FlgE [Castellaniella defragrans]KAB0609775.1 flagellar hook protein FlgE [Castellaniella defragrans]MBB6082402.1 flagellar hook protein FlgE [Castellaniella defragrans]CDM24825.1 Flagellar hook protein FlgE [Castellaniella defragrans 65Phen]